MYYCPDCLSQFETLAYRKIEDGLLYRGKQTMHTVEIYYECPKCGKCHCVSGMFRKKKE